MKYTFPVSPSSSYYFCSTAFKTASLFVGEYLIAKITFEYARGCTSKRIPGHYFLDFFGGVPFHGQLVNNGTIVIECDDEGDIPSLAIAETGEQLDETLVHIEEVFISGQPKNLAYFQRICAYIDDAEKIKDEKYVNFPRQSRR